MSSVCWLWSLLLCSLTSAHASGGRWNCTESLLSGVQWVDAGDGHVVAVGQNQQAFRLTGSGWSNLGSRRLEHVTVGAAGVWGTDESRRVYKYISDDFEHVPGMILSQVDAGGDGAVVGIRLGFFGFNSIACLKKSFSTSVVGDGQLQWKTDSMLMKYISCGPQLGCWGVNMNRIYFTESFSPTTCESQGWRHVPGPNMNMIKVGRDGEVFGLSEGSVFRRTGITFYNREGSGWERVHLSSGQDVKHLTYDQDQLWVVTTDSLLLKCSGARSSSVLMMIIGSLIVSLLFH